MTPETREKLARVRSIPALERVSERVRSFSSGDRVLFYLLAIIVGIASISGLYALERSLLIEVPAYGGTLVEGELGSPRFINPLLAMSDADRDLSSCLPGLMGFSERRIDSVLADSYEISDDGKLTHILKRTSSRWYARG